jgi:hypothetical protein
MRLSVPPRVDDDGLRVYASFGNPLACAQNDKRRKAVRVSLRRRRGAERPHNISCNAAIHTNEECKMNRHNGYEKRKSKIPVAMQRNGRLEHLIL